MNQNLLKGNNHEINQDLSKEKSDENSVIFYLLAEVLSISFPFWRENTDFVCRIIIFYSGEKVFAFFFGKLD